MLVLLLPHDLEGDPLCPEAVHPVVSQVGVAQLQVQEVHAVAAEERPRVPCANVQLHRGAVLRRAAPPARRGAASRRARAAAADMLRYSRPR